MAEKKDVVRLLKGQRLSDEEKTEALLFLAGEVTPKVETSDGITLVTIAQTWDASDKLMRDGDGIVGLSTGYSSLDKLTRGMRQGQLIILAGDTGHGKSLLVQNITRKVAEAGTPVLFIALEMLNEENTERFRSMGISKDLPIFYPSSNDINYKDVDKLVETAVDSGAELVVIDHLHMFDFSGYAREDIGITAVVKEFKLMAQRHQVPVILVSHISERSEADQNKPPQLRHLKGSSSIKQLADTALFVWNQGEVEVTGKNELTVLLKKGRTGKKHLSTKLRIMDDMKLVEPVFTG